MAETVAAVAEPTKFNPNGPLLRMLTYEYLDSTPRCSTRMDVNTAAVYTLVRAEKWCQLRPRTYISAPRYEALVLELVGGA